MMKLLKLIVLCIGLWFTAEAVAMKSIQEFGVLPTHSPELNKANLQKAIDWATESGSALYVEPVADGYPMETGILLRKNVSLIGVHGPTGRGTKHPNKQAPVGSLFKITDDKEPFITVQSATQLRGIQFWYPEQTHTKAADIIAYQPTIQLDRESPIVQGVTLSNLTFYGEYVAMDFKADGANGKICEQILFEHCYGYPLSGEFIKIDYCYDIPRMLHCHINPANMREFGRTFSKEVIDAVIANGTFSYWIDHTDNAQLIDIFTFGAYGGIYLGGETYGQLTNFNLDCVAVGIHKLGNSTKNRNWQIAQGSIIANTGAEPEHIHPFIIEGQGHVSLANVEAFSGHNGALTTIEHSKDFMLVKGDKKLTISLLGCRMRNYTSAHPFTIENPQAIIQAVACIDKNEEIFAEVIQP